MLLINKITDPGGIKKVALRANTVQIDTRDGRCLIYRLVPDAFIPDNGANGQAPLDEIGGDQDLSERADLNR